MAESSHSGLVVMEGFRFPVYSSAGVGDRARAVARRAERALDWFSRALGASPTFTLFVVDPSDWGSVAEVPIYGMPHAWVDKLVVGADPASFWSAIVDDFWPDLSDGAREKTKQIYGDPPDLGVFADLIVVHELAHLFHGFDPATLEIDFPRRWLAEFFANLGLCGYLAENEPNQLPVLETIALAAEEVSPNRMVVRALDDMGRAFEYENGPVIYGWYQLRLIAGASRVWQEGGLEAMRAFYEQMRRPKMPAAEIEKTLDAVSPEAGRLSRNWPR